MLKRLCCLVAGALLCSFSTAHAAPAPLPWGWAVVANEGNGLPITDPGFIGESIFTVDVTKNPAVVHGPYLSGQLSPPDPVTGDPTTGGGVFDVEQIPGTPDVLISNFGSSMIYRVSLKNPLDPVVVGSVQIDFFAEDIVVTRDGRLALVSDGGFSPRLAFVDVETMTHKATVPLHEGPAYDPLNPPDPLPTQYYANAVDVSPDGQVVVMADYFGSAVIYGKINATRDGFESLNQFHLCNNWDAIAKTCGADDYVSRPVNVTISPDGNTVLATDTDMGMVSVLRITKINTLVKGTPFQLWGLPNTLADYYKFENNTSGAPFYKSPSQSIMFSPRGDKAYLLQNGTTKYIWNGSAWVADATVNIPNKLSWINITGPGQASVGGAWVANLFADSGSQLFGVDNLALSKGGRYAYASNPTISGASGSITKVDLTTFASTEIHIDPTHPFNPDPLTYERPLAIPVGITVIERPFNWSMFVPGFTHGGI